MYIKPESADLGASQIFDWHGASKGSHFCRGHVVLELRNGTTWGREMYHFSGGQAALDMGKWCTWTGEMGYLIKREPALDENVMTLNALKLSNILLSKAIGTIKGKEKTVFKHAFKP